MTEDPKVMSCEEFDAHMSEMIATGQDIFTHPHVQSCELHKALLADLEAIARVAKDLFPEVDPPDDLWKDIEGKLS